MALFKVKESKTDVIKSLIKRRRIQMLVHSCIYYELNDSLVDDHTWQSWADELVKLQKDYPKEAEQVEWAEAFKEWTGDTGHHLEHRHPWVLSTSQYLLNTFKNINDNVLLEWEKKYGKAKMQTSHA